MRLFSQSTLAIAAIGHRHHGGRIFLAGLVIILIVVAAVYFYLRHRDNTVSQRASIASESDKPIVTSAVPQGGLGKMNELPPGRYSMRGLLASEWTKLRTVRSTMWTIGLTVVLGIGLSALAAAETRANWSSMSYSDRLTFDPTQVSLIGVAFGQFVIGILGVLVMTAEYGTGTIRATLSAAPQRWKVLVAKTVVFGAVALIVSEVVAFIAFFLGQSLLSAPAVHATLSTPEALRQVLGSGLYLFVLGLFALGLATIIRHTAGAISAFVGTLLVLPLIVSALPGSISQDIRRFLPANIGNSISSAFPGPHQFSPWTGLAVLAGYTVVALIIGGVLLVRRDA